MLPLPEYLGVGRCTVEIPYVGVPFPGPQQQLERRRRLLLSFTGSFKVCCEPRAGGPSTRNAVRRLAELTRGNPRIEIRDTVRFASQRSTTDGSAATGDSAAYRVESEGARRYQQLSALFAESEFCLVPAGDTAATSRLYSAIAMGCIPVVISDSLSRPPPSVDESYSRHLITAQ